MDNEIDTIVTKVKNFYLTLFPSMTDVQELAIQPILNRTNSLIIAPTGYGKTEAAIIPCCFAIDRQVKGLKLLYITPLKALNRDMYKRFEFLKDLSISYAVRHGDTSEKEKKRLEHNNPDLLITTPETLQLLLVNKNYDFSQLQYVIIDEIHELIDSKRGVEISLSLERLQRKVKSNLTRIGLSATVSNKNEVSQFLSGIGRTVTIVETNIKKKFVFDVRKPSSLNKIVEEISQLSTENKIIVFTNTREMAEILASYLVKLIPCRIHHGSLSKTVREEAEADFRSGRVKCIVATSSLELGIDIGDVNLVIQISSPKRIEKLIQRAGRSSHTIEGTSNCIIYTLSIEDYAESISLVKAVESYGNDNVENRNILRSSYDVIGHQVLGLLAESFDERNENQGLSIFEVHELFKNAYCYSIDIKKLAEIVFQLSNNGLLFYDLRQGKIFPRFSGKLNYLKNCSFIPSYEQYTLLNSANNRKIATLDYTFVQRLNVDDIFLTKGTSWRCLAIDNEKKQVIAVEEKMAIAVPDWIGEDIPVDYNIAQQVRKNLNVENYYVEISKENSLFVLYTHLGTKMNRAFEICLRDALTQMGYKVSSFSDAYRIVISDQSLFLNLEKIMLAIKRINPRNAIINSNQYINTLSQNLRHFGIIHEPRGYISFDYARSLADNVIGEEAINYCKFKYFDFGFLKKLDDLNQNIRVYNDLSIRTLEFLDYLGMNLVVEGHNQDPHYDAVSSLKQNLDKKEVFLCCTYCKNKWYSKVSLLQETIKCAKCQSMMIEVNSLKDSEILTRTYGKKAVYALSTYGISTTTAKRILQKNYEDERHFLLALLQAQMQFIRTHRFWRT
ncbi:MAG: DEAD/DEAH box helicase [Candidatus Micrarchaeota archaeon]|nr:DEAD/DEAH box helicase [Candidatus Micrarchaeota archaeon]